MVVQAALIIMLHPLQEVVAVAEVHYLQTEVLELKAMLEVTVTQSIIILVVAVVSQLLEIVPLEVNRVMAVLH